MLSPRSERSGSEVFEGRFQCINSQKLRGSDLFLFGLLGISLPLKKLENTKNRIRGRAKDDLVSQKSGPDGLRWFIAHSMRKLP
jgi:hypothetical protein